MSLPSPDLQTCMSSASCVLGTVLGTGVPVLVLSLAILRALGVGTPSILKEFISHDDILEENLDSREAETQSSDAVTDEPTEQSPLLPPRTYHTATRPSTWRQATLTILALLHISGALIILVSYAKHPFEGWGATFGLVKTSVSLATWTYVALRINFRPSCTPYYDIFTLYLAELLTVLVHAYEYFQLTGYEHLKFGLIMVASQALCSCIGIAAIVTMPLNVVKRPQTDRSKRIAPEDDCTLWEWVTFSWVGPLVALGSVRPLEEKDVWNLSKTMRTDVLMRKFLGLRHPSLLRRLFVANSKDIILDCSLTLLATLMEFSAPLFMNLILRAVMAEPTPNNAPDLFTSPISSSLRFYASVVLDSPMVPSTVRNAASSLKDPETSRSLQRNDAYFFAVALCIGQLIMAQSNLQCLYFSRRATIRIDTELTASIYEKILRHKDVSGTTSEKAQTDQPDDPEKSSGGETSRIISLISADVHRLSVTFSQGPFVYECIFSIFIACTMLYNLMGWTAFSGYLVLLFAMPINALTVKRAAALHRIEFTMRDRRIQAVNEAVQAIKLIKFSGWESRWINRVLNVRQTELKWLRELKILYIFIRMMWELVPVLVLATSFICFTLFTRREMTVDVAFPCITIFGILSPSLTSLPMITNWAIQCLLALKRIDNYLSEPDVPDHVSSLKRPTTMPQSPVDTRIGCTNATFRWSIASTGNSGATDLPNKPSTFARAWHFVGRALRLRKKAAMEEETPEVRDDRSPFELKDISVLFPEAEISLVCGPTGSGKSALLAALLGEMDCFGGDVFLPKEPMRLHDKTGLPLTISYCAQQPWLEHKSIKDNILFGSPFEQSRYEATLGCCALLPDLAIFPRGDETEIGEKGVSLSGGQKARVALARAVYARTQVVLLDDVLSAVDTHTAEHIVNQCLLGPLMRQRTVVLVTHHVDLVLPIVAWTVKLREGRMEAQGTVPHLREAGKLARNRTASEEDHKVKNADASSSENATRENSMDSGGKLVEEEQKDSGMVRPEVYKTYLSATSYWLFGIHVACIASDQLMQLVEKFWLKHWSESYVDSSISTISRHWNGFDFPSASQDALPYLLVFVGIEGAIAVIGSINQIPRTVASLRASRILFGQVLRSVMRSPSRFFDKTPSGRILNRFGKDIDVIDGQIHDSMHMFLKQIAILVVSVAAVVYVFPPFAAFALVIACLYIWFAHDYISTSRDLRRIESITRSPILSSFSELINGIATVRAFGSERLLLNTLFERLDRTQAASYHFWMCNRWLIFRFDSLGAVSVLIATIGSLAAGASAGLTGIAIVQAQKLVIAIHRAIRDWTGLEQSLTSVERVHEYLTLPSEPPATTTSVHLAASWPSTSQGTLAVQNLVIKYAPELEPVLHGVSFETKPSEKIGIVGRTGSGKSTLALSIFRFVDPASGTIVLDGIDITTIGLDDLRSRLTLISQDAVLFRGTIRDNLDPFKEYTDAECIESLYRVHLNTPPPPRSAPVDLPQLGSSAENHPNNAQSHDADSFRDTGPGSVIFTLDTKVSEGGSNFSHGQRQLLSLARALLRKSNVIVMDESTASIDFETDARIQSTIRNEFKQSILLTIAHRLRTVMDNDRILVLDGGRVVEFDTPLNLLGKSHGIFHDMCRRSGDYDELMRIAHSKA